jgi:hypothetical protein
MLIESILSHLFHAWINVSTAYEKLDVMLSFIRDSREYARNQLTLSGTSVHDKKRTTQLPNHWKNFLTIQKWAIEEVFLFPITISAVLSRIGATSEVINFHGYWLSPSVFTRISAPFLSAFSTPVRNAFQSPAFFLWIKIWVTQKSRATAIVLSLLQSSIIWVSIAEIHAIFWGSSCKTFRSVSSSL